MSARGSASLVAPSAAVTAELARGVITYEAVVRQLEGDLRSARPSRRGSTEYSRLVSTYGEAVRALADLRKEVGEEGERAAGGAGGFKLRIVLVVVIDGLLAAMNERIISPGTFASVWEHLVEAGVWEVAGLSSAEALELHAAYRQAQRDLDTDPAILAARAAEAGREGG